MTITPDMVPQNQAPPPPEDPATLGENFWASWQNDTVTRDTAGHEEGLRREMLRQGYSLLSPEGRTELGRLTANRQFDDPLAAHTTLMLDLLSREAAKDPVRVGNFPLDQAQLDSRITTIKEAELADARAILDRPGGGFGEFLGSAARSMADPINIALAPFGAGGGLGRMMLSEAVLNGFAEGLAVPREAEVSAELGLPEPDMKTRVAEGAAFGAGLTGLIGGALRFGSYVLGHRQAARGTAPAGTHPIEHEGAINAEKDRLSGNQPLSETLKDEAAKGTGAALSMSDFDFSLAGNASPRTNRVGYVYGKLLARGVEPHIASAIVGNAMQEAGPGLNPAIIGDGGNAMGLFQWNGPRMRALQEFARKAGRPAEDIDTQVDFLFYELEGSEAGAWAKIRTAKTAEEAAALFSNLFERPGTPHLNRRIAYAATVHDQYTNGIVPVWRGATVDPGPLPEFTTSRGYTGAGQVSTASGRTIDVEYIVADASLLKRASGDLQPRDRSRANSDAWIADTAARLDPAQLMPSPNAATGTPIVGPDKVIESGNGRFGAIMAAYDRFPDRAAAYRKAIEDFTGKPVPEGIERPVLVAERRSPLDPEARRQFVIEAQDSGVARMTPTEIARTSSRAMTPDLLARLDPEADLLDPANGAFVRGALDALPASERNALFNPEGGLNKAGQARLREAMFARAWDAPDILTRFTETDGGDLKSLMDALDEAAPAWAALKADIEAGRVRADADISPFVIEAMRLIAAARDLAAKDGLPMANALSELLDEVDLFEGALSPLTTALIRNKFWKNGKAASASEIGDFLKRYAAEARKVATADNMFTVPTAEILRKIDPKVFGDLPDDLGAPRAVATRAAPEIAPPMAEEAFAKGADAPEAVEADSVALEALRPAEPSSPDRIAPEVEAARNEFSGLTVDLPDGSRLSASDLLDDIEADERLAEVLAVCNPGGQA